MLAEHSVTGEIGVTECRRNIVPETKRDDGLDCPALTLPTSCRDGVSGCFKIAISNMFVNRNLIFPVRR